MSIHSTDILGQLGRWRGQPRRSYALVHHHDGAMRSERGAFLPRAYPAKVVSGEEEAIVGLGELLVGTTTSSP